MLCECLLSIHFFFPYLIMQYSQTFKLSTQCGPLELSQLIWLNYLVSSHWVSQNPSAMFCPDLTILIFFHLPNRVLFRNRGYESKADFLAEDLSNSNRIRSHWGCPQQGRLWLSAVTAILHILSGKTQRLSFFLYIKAAFVHACEGECIRMWVSLCMRVCMQKRALR